jgi:hypothetical protein
MQTPFIKHIVGVFGICDASAKTLKRTLARRSVVLYPGGIAELFLCDHEQERLFVHKRKGFVKVALQAGVDIVPVYFFGNTQARERERETHKPSQHRTPKHIALMSSRFRRSPVSEYVLTRVPSHTYTAPKLVWYSDEKVANRNGWDLGWEIAHELGRFAAPADSPLHDCSPCSHVHARRESLGFVHIAQAILRRPVPNT